MRRPFGAHDFEPSNPAHREYQAKSLYSCACVTPRVLRFFNEAKMESYQEEHKVKDRARSTEFWCLYTRGEPTQALAVAFLQR